MECQLRTGKSIFLYYTLRCYMLNIFRMHCNTYWRKIAIVNFLRPSFLTPIILFKKKRIAREESKKKIETKKEYKKSVNNCTKYSQKKHWKIKKYKKIKKIKNKKIKKIWKTAKIKTPKNIDALYRYKIKTKYRIESNQKESNQNKYKTPQRIKNPPTYWIQYTIKYIIHKAGNKQHNIYLLNTFYY